MCFYRERQRRGKPLRRGLFEALFANHKIADWETGAIRRRVRRRSRFGGLGGSPRSGLGSPGPRPPRPRRARARRWAARGARGGDSAHPEPARRAKFAEVGRESVEKSLSNALNFLRTGGSAGIGANRQRPMEGAGSAARGAWRAARQSARGRWGSTGPGGKGREGTGARPGSRPRLGAPLRALAKLPR